MLVENVPLKFLVDSGATQSLIMKKCLPHAPLSGKIVHSTGASGQAVPETVTSPLNTTDPFDHTTHRHQFLLSQSCPVNLLARDLILKFNLSIDCGSDGLVVSKSPQAVDTLVTLAPDLLFVFEWSLIDENQRVTLTSMARDRLPPSCSFMYEQQLHCTVHVTPDPADQLGDSFMQTPPTDLHSTDICWTNTECFLLIHLTDDTTSQTCYFTVSDSFPHVSLAKSFGAQWRSLGPLALKAHLASDWQQWDTCLYSPSLNMYRQPTPAVLPAEPTKEVIDTSA